MTDDEAVDASWDCPLPIHININNIRMTGWLVAVFETRSGELRCVVESSSKTFTTYQPSVLARQPEVNLPAMKRNSCRQL